MLKKVFAFTMLFGTCILLHAQEEKTSKFSISAFTSPTIARRTLSGSDSVWPNFTDRYNENETLKPGYSTGLLFSYRASKNISIQSGISFTNNGYRTRKRELIIDNQFPVRDTDPTHFKIVSHYYYIDVPAYVKYIFLKKKKISLYAIGGVEANFNVSNKYTTTLWSKEGKDSKTQEFETYGSEFRKVNCSVAIGAGFDIALNSRVSLFIQPTYRQMLLNLIKDAPVIRRLYSAGLVTGITMNL